MTLTVELTPEEAQLLDLARQKGLPAEEHARRRLITDLIRARHPDPKGEALTRLLTYRCYYRIGSPAPKPAGR